MIPDGYKEFMKEKIDEYIEEHHKLPQKSELKHLAIEPLIFEYGNWRNVLIEFGYKKKETPESAFQSLQELQKELMGLPTLPEAKQYGIDTRLLINEFGSWKNVKHALKQATDDPYQIKRTKQKKFNEKIESDEQKIIELTKKNKKIPTARIIRNNDIDINRILLKYGSLNMAKKELKLYDIYEDIVKKDLKKISKKKTNKELFMYLKKIDFKPLISKYGSVENLCKELNIPALDIEKIREEILEEMKKQRKLPDMNYLKNQGIELRGLLEIYKTWKNIITALKLDVIEEEMLVEDIISLMKKLGHVPTVKEIKEANLNINKIFKKYNGWKNFREKYKIEELFSETHFESIIDDINIKKEILQISRLIKIIGHEPTIEEAKEYDIDTNILLQSYPSWNFVLSVVKKECHA